MADVAVQNTREVQVHRIPWRKDCSMIVPSSAVAEVLYNMEVSPAAKPTDWVKGVIPWRGLPVPLVCFDAIADALPEPVEGESSRVLICRTLGFDSSYSHFAIEFYRLPRHQLVYDHSMTVISDESKASEWPFVARVQIAENDVFVLDIEALCRLLQ